MCNRTNLLPFIGITQRLTEYKNYGELRENLAVDWGILFSKHKLFCDFIPLPLSYEVGFSKYLPYIRAVILSGGGDLSTVDDSKISKIRDNYEIDVIDCCIRNNIPLLGVCRGAQMIASYFNSSIKAVGNHIGLHNVYIEDKAFMVNSFHNYSVDSLGDDLVTIAVTKNGDIEAFRHKTFNIYGIMWHIERENGMLNVSIVESWLKDIK